VHMAGADIQIDSVIRQRCAWCGTLLIEYDLNRIAVIDGQALVTWTVGALVVVDGGMSWIDESAQAHDLPANSCAFLDVEVTR
jgi:hypothetical protein